MKNYIGILFFAFLLIAGCSDVNLLHPYGNDDGVAPGPVSDIQVRNWSGAATISYTLPDDADLSYVKATFTGTNGEAREMRASAYVDSLVIEGFGDTREYVVELRAYDKFENASEPETVTVQPTTPPIALVRESLDWAVDFGGFLVTFENVTGSNIGLYVVRRDTVSLEMEYYDVHFTEQKEGSYAVRGLPDIENDFGVYVRDNWGNSSDTLTFTTTPYREDELDKEKFMAVDGAKVPGDLLSSQFNKGMEYMWNGTIDNWDYFEPKYPTQLPHRFTMDLGVVCRMSRMKYWQRSGDDVRWQHGAWRIFNVYGCTELPPLSEASADDPMKGWTLIGAFESVKPSGLPIGQVSDEDIQLLQEGEEFSFDKDAPAIRYMRFEIISPHSTMQHSSVSEITLWGQIEDDDPDNLEGE